MAGGGIIDWVRSSSPSSSSYFAPPPGQGRFDIKLPMGTTRGRGRVPLWAEYRRSTVTSGDCDIDVGKSHCHVNQLSDVAALAIMGLWDFIPWIFPFVRATNTVCDYGLGVGHMRVHLRQGAGHKDKRDNTLQNGSSHNIVRNYNWLRGEKD